MSEPLIPSIDLDFTFPPPIPPEAVARANELMSSGMLFRYGEFNASEQDAAMLEREFAELVGTRYAVAFNSCGAALTAALYAVGVAPGDQVLMNAFTLAPVPGSIARLGAEPVFVETTADLTIDLVDLERKAAGPEGKVLMLSHMRGHISDMDAVVEICARNEVTLVEDCAHTMGAGWAGTPSGAFGTVGCFSTQTFKHVNSGEGGLLVTDDDEVAARAILFSGSYMLYAQHGVVPPDDVMRRQASMVPNCSSRMSALVAALVRPQLPLLVERAELWNARYRQLEAGLNHRGFVLPVRPEAERYVASSIQFNPGLSPVEVEAFVALAAAHGVAVKWFGRDQPVGFTSRYDHWRYAAEQSLPATSAVLAAVCDMRIPLSMSEDDADLVVEILAACREATAGSQTGDHELHS